MIIKMPVCINGSDISGYKELIRISKSISEAPDTDHIVLNFKELCWIDANLLAVFGAILEQHINRVKIRYVKNSIQPKIGELLAKNNFGKYFSMSEKSDINDTIIKYTITKGTDIKKFAQYFKESVLMRHAMPILSDSLKEKILENVLEIFGNAPLHAGCSHVFSCGQIFPQKNILKFTIANTGYTIKENVIEYYGRVLNRDSFPKYTISWATQEYNSTKTIVNGKSGGLGLFYLKQFTDRNNGSITICSADEIWQYSNGQEKNTIIDDIFSGTIVTIVIRTDDRNVYCLEGEDKEIFTEF